MGPPARAILVAACFAAAPVAAQQALPDLGGVADGALPAQVERRIGEDLVRELRLRDPSYVDDPEVTEYVNSLGARLVAASVEARQSFEFFVVRDPSINAFALPGGFIGLHTGLITSVGSESELASVLAHEIAHVTQRHIARMIGAQQRMQVPALVALAAAILLGGSRPDLAAGAAAAIQAGAVQSALNYTRSFEREADRIGFGTLTRAGFDGHAMGAFFEHMQRANRVSDDGTLPSYFRTHPLDSERIADSQNRSASLPYRQVADSLEFHLVRARLRAETGEAGEAVAYFAALVRDRRFANEAAARYGWINALLRAKRPREAQTELARLRALGVTSPMLETLDAAVHGALGDAAGALRVLGAAVARTPRYLPLTYAYVEALQAAGRNEEALAQLVEPLRRHRSDPRLHELRARSYAQLGKRLLQHQALAEVYALRGSLPAAIEQLQLARASGDGNFYQLSEVDARLRELRARYEQDQRDRRRDER